MSDGIIPVGRDCDCGFPLVWRDGQQRCSVYGTHPVDHARFPDSPAGTVIHYRNYAAPGSALVTASLAAPNMTRNAIRQRALRAVS